MPRRNHTRFLRPWTPLRVPLKQRFWAHVEQSAAGCWLWTGSLQPSGYGAISLGRTEWGRMQAHVFSWLLHNPGVIPPDHQVCHKCDVRHCVRPDHLFLGTQADNIHDMVRKGRHWHQRPR
jgi:hypothetical protein